MHIKKMVHWEKKNKKKPLPPTKNPHWKVIIDQQASIIFCSVFSRCDHQDRIRRTEGSRVQRQTVAEGGFRRVSRSSDARHRMHRQRAGQRLHQRPRQRETERGGDDDAQPEAATLQERQNHRKTGRRRFYRRKNKHWHTGESLRIVDLRHESCHVTWLTLFWEMKCVKMASGNAIVWSLARSLVCLRQLPQLMGKEAHIHELNASISFNFYPLCCFVS